MENEFTWKCIVCEKEVEIIYEEQQDLGILPNMEGGTIEFDFGYGSRFDTLNEPHRIQGCICDNCFVNKKHLTRKVAIVHSFRIVTDE